MSDNVIIPVRSEQAIEALVRLAKHVPREIEIGKPTAAAWNESEGAVMFFMTVAVWWSYPAYASRLIESGALVELTHWADGREAQRTLRPMSAVRPSTMDD